MRRRLNNAYLAQIFLMICLLVLLVILAQRGASPLTFSLVFLGGIIVAAAPSIYSGYVLPRRDYKRAAQVLQSGLLSSARVLQDGDQILDEFRRGTMGHKGVNLLLDVPVMLHPADENRTSPMSMKADIASLQPLKTGMVVSVRCDLTDPHYIVLDNSIPPEL